MGFRRGDCVVFPKYGVGKVVKAEERPVFGRTQRCLEIKFPVDNRRVFVQEADFTRSHIRPVMAKKVVGRIYKLLREPAQYVTVKTSPVRTEKYRAKAQIGDPMSLAEVARDLVRRSQRHRLSEMECQLAEAAVALLSQEIAHVEQREPSEVRTKLERMLTR